MSRRKPTLISFDMIASKWKFLLDYGSCVGCPLTPTQDTITSWKFNLPRIEDGIGNKVGYLLCPHTSPIIQSSLNGDFEISGTLGTQFIDGKEPFNDSVLASFRYIIYKDLTSEFGRWWSNPFGIILSEHVNNGPISLNVPFTSFNWSSVNGKSGNNYPTEFQAALKAPQYVGLTFGAGGDFGHGIRTQNGTAVLKASNIRLT